MDFDDDEDGGGKVSMSSNKEQRRSRGSSGGKKENTGLFGGLFRGSNNVNKGAPYGDSGGGLDLVEGEWDDGPSDPPSGGYQAVSTSTEVAVVASPVTSKKSSGSQTAKGGVMASLARILSPSSSSAKPAVRVMRSHEEMLAKVKEVGHFFVQRQDTKDVDDAFFDDVLARTITPGKRGTVIVFRGGIGFYCHSDDCVSFFHPWSRIKGWGKIDDQVTMGGVAGYLHVPLPNQEQTVALEFVSMDETGRFLSACHETSNTIATPEERVANDTFGTHPVDDENW